MPLALVVTVLWMIVFYAVRQRLCRRIRGKISAPGRGRRRLKRPDFPTQQERHRRASNGPIEIILVKEAIMTLIGPHIDPPLAAIPGLLTQSGYTTFQTTLRDPLRLSKDGIPDPTDQELFRSACAVVGPFWGIAHASLLTNPASPDPRIRNSSASALVADATLAAALGLAGVCFHGGYQKGHSDREAALDALAYKLDGVLGKLPTGARVLLENSCEGTELGQTIAELGQIVAALHADPAKLGLVIDTCHLHVAGFDLSAPDAPERLAAEMEAAGMTPYLTALHLNDAREACGSHRDRHAIPGQGTIGEGLRRLRAHPLFGPLPAILEIARSEVPQAIAFLES
jgi:deoxyribonuclease-4